MSYSRSSYRSSAHRYSEGVSDDSFSRSSFTSSTRSSLGHDESLTGRSSRFSSSITGTGLDDLSSVRRTSLRGSRFDDDDSGISSYRRTTRTSSRGDDDDLGLTSYRRRTSGISDDDDSYSYRKTKISSAYEADDSSRSVRSSRQTTVVSESSGDSAYSSYLKYGTKVIQESTTEGTLTEVEAKPGDIYAAILDYDPPKSDTDGIALKENQEVECLNTANPRRWQVKTRACAVSQEVVEGWVPSAYLERKEAAVTIVDLKRQEAITKREAVVKQLVETEEDFVRDMQNVVNNYVKEMESSSTPKDVRDQKDVIFSNFKAISDFHNNVLIKGVQYYANEPAKLGKTFLRLERDFDMHVNYCRDEPLAQEALQSGPVKEYFAEFSKKIKDDKSLSDHLKLPIQRINDYQLLLKEVLKYTAQLKEETEDLEKALDFMQAIPQRIADMKYLNSLHGYKGNVHKLGRILKKEWFEVTDENNVTREKFVFLFKRHIFIVDERKITDDRSAYLVKNIVKIQDANIQETVEGDNKKLVIKSKKGDTLMSLKAKTSEQKEEWVKELHTKVMQQVSEDLSEDEFQIVHEEISETEAKKPKLSAEDRPKSVEEEKMQSETDAKVEILEDFEAYEEMNTAVTESLRSGSLTSLEGAELPRDHEAPTLTAELADVEVSEGASAMLELKASGYPKPKITWMKGEEEITAGERYKFLFEGTDNYTLVIKKVTKGDAGQYTAILKNDTGETSCSCQLGVKSAPVFRKPMKDMAVMTDEPVKFEVEIEGSPTPEIKWFKDGQKVKSNDRIKIFHEAELHSLLIEKAKPEDSGNYSCVASNANGEQAGFGALAVNSPAKVVQKMKSVECDEEETVSFSVKVGGNPKPTVKWMKEDEELIVEKKRIKVIEEESNSYTLTIDKVIKEDAGKYSCKVTNEYGSDTTSGNLTVNETSVPPSFVQGLSDMAAKNGEDVSFTVKLKGQPKPSVKWTKDDAELTIDGKHIKTVEEASDSLTLVLKNVDSKDAGKYACEISNSSGKETSSGKLSVQTPCAFIERLKDTEVEENVDASFTIKISGEPKPDIKWTKDGAALKIDGRHIEQIEEDSATFTLVIKDVTKDDVGEYSCEISNKHGKDVSSGKLGIAAKPTFKRKLVDKESTEGDTDVEFVVEVGGSPTPKIQWFIGDVEITSSDKYSIVSDSTSYTHKLVAKKVSSDMSGNYKCKASNKHGSADTSAAFTVYAKPKIIEGLKDVQIEEGNSVEMTVKIAGCPAPDVKWKRNGEDVSAEATIKITKEVPNVTTLIIDKVTLTLVGEYECVITNKLGEASTKGKLSVKSKPSFKKGLKDLTIWSGEETVFEVVVNGYPTPSVTWTKDGKTISSNEHVKITSEENSHCLRIKSTKMDDGGNYKCTAKNDVGEASESSVLTVKSSDDSQIPTFIRELIEQEILLGDAVRMEVKVVGKPTPDITWYHNDEEIKSDNRIRVDSVLNDNYYSLTIKDVILEDEGNYMCKAINEKGETSSSATLVVEEPTAPEIKGMKSSEVSLSTPGKFEVEITGVPAPEVEWYKDGQLLYESNNIVISEDDVQHFSVIVRNVKEENIGTYKCVAVNSAGEASSEAKLSIKNEAPSFLKEIGDREVKKGDNLVFEVRVSGYPMPEVSWFQNNSPIIVGEHCKISHKDDIFKLDIIGASVDHIGTYTCKAVNSTGEKSCKGALHLIEVAPSLQKGLHGTLTVKEGEPLKLEAKFDADINTDIEWTKDGNEIKPSDHIKIENKPDGSTKLVINNAKLDDAGKYAVVAKNNKGKADSESKVSIEPKVKKTKPSFIKRLEEVECLQNETGVLEGKVSGEPTPTIEWFKDNNAIKASDKFTIKMQSDGQIQLTINNISLEDAGEYKAVATNNVGEASSSAKVTVKSPPPPKEEPAVKPKEAAAPVEAAPKPTVSEEPPSQAAPVTEAVAAKPIIDNLPKFTMGLKPAQFTEGEPGELVAKVAGEPLPKIKWLKNGKPILPSDRYKLTENPDGTVSLLIDKVTPEDAGRYALVLTNENGDEKSEAPVAVIPTIKKVQKPRPNFTIAEGLQPVMLPEGQSGRMQVKVTGEGKPTAVWKKDGKDILPSDHIKFVEEPDGIYALIIDKCIPGDTGKYAVVLSNESGEEKSDALMTVVPKIGIAPSGKKPEFLQNLKPQEVVTGQPITLQAKVTGEPKPTIKWLKDGDDIRPTSGITMKEEPDGTVTLKIDSASPSDAGKYVVVATNDEGKTRSAAPVEVKASPKRKPEFLSDLQPVTCNDGEAATLQAKVIGEPKPQVKWLKDGHEIKPSGHVKMTEEPDGTIKLSFPKVTPKDSGKYAVAIANDEGETRSSAPLTVNQPPVFIKPLLPVTVINGLPGKLEAKVAGVPEPTIEWLKNGEAFLADSEHTKLHNPDGTVMVLFEKTKPDHAGRYTCVAKNSFGTCHAAADLSVIGKEVENEPELPPAFVSPLYDVSVNENEPIRFEATVSGNPLPDIHWFLDEQPVLASNNVHPMFDGKKVALEIKKCNPQHGGNYECHLVNRAGNAVSKAKAKVTGFSAPHFVQKLVDLEAPTTDPVKLTCKVVGFPEPDIEWYRNKDLLYPGIKYSMSKEGELCHLSIPYPRARDSGTYECLAKNVMGEDKCGARIEISDHAERGEAPIFLKKLIDIEALEGSCAKFTACVTGIPKPLVKWFKDGEQLEPSKHYKMEHEPNGILRLMIYLAKPNDIGEYRVSVSNKYGSDTCTARLHLAGVDEYVPVCTGEDDKLHKTAPPSPLPDPPFIMHMTDTYLSLGWRPSIPTFPRVPVTYEVEMSQGSDGPWSSYRSGLKDSMCDVRGLIPGQDYRFRIRVENKHGVSDPSPYISAYRSKLQPPVPGEYMPKDYEIEHPPLDKHAAAPRFLRKEEETMYGIRGQPVRIEFWVYGHPQPDVSWLFNGQQVDTGKYDFLQDRNGQVILFITRMTENDIGTYVCHAVNEHGEARQRIKLLIAEPPVFKKRLEETTVMLRSGGKLECCVTGVPFPKIKWFKDWHPIYESSRIKIQHIEPDKCILSLSGAILKDSGLYSCCASNVAGNASSSANISVEECTSDYLLYNADNIELKPRSKIFEDVYDIGDELGRGTQGIVHHAVERSTGRSLAAKLMHGTGKMRDFMEAEMDVMNQLNHPRLVHLWDAFDTKSSLTLITDLCGGGELLNNLLHREKLTESDVAHYIKQVLEGLEHMHSKFIGHLGLTIGDLLITRVNSDNLKICDFGLSTRLQPGREYIQEYGHPEFVAPEVANKLPVSLAADMWSVGIITYLLLTGSSPFLGENDRETLKSVQEGKVNFFHDNYVVLSDEAKDFVSKLLVFDPSGRLDVKAALKHPWLRYADIPDKCDELNSLASLHDYHKKWKEWHDNASCKRFYRRRPLESCFTHPSRMIYPPDIEYTPTTTPERQLGRSHIKPAAFDDVTFQQKIIREPIDFRSESQYQSGPDTFLLPLRDKDFPIRVRQYLRLGARRSPTLAKHLREKHWGDSDIAVRERRRFVDVMDEEIYDEKKGLVHSMPLRLQKEIGSFGLEIGRKKSIQNAQFSAPYFREKIRDVIIREDEEAVFKCYAVAKPAPLYSWFRNDGILIESSRIEIKQYKDSHCELRLKPGKAYDVGLFKCVARNDHGVAVCRARLKIGDVPGHPEPPIVQQCSDTELYVVWNPPKNEGNSPVLCYSLEYKKSDEEKWTKAAKNIAHEFFVIRELCPLSTYQLRLSAKNRFGWGESSPPSEPCNTLAAGSPKVKISKARKYQQEMTEMGQELFSEELEVTHLDYSLEDNPIEMVEGDPLELYNFVSEVARGRFSVIVKVWAKKQNTTLIAKVMQRTPETEAAIWKEFDILRSLKHERIVSLETASTNPTSTILIMEKLSGMDILTYFSCRHQYTEEMVAKVVTQVLDALEYLHFRGICYLELQPDNVVLTNHHHLDVKLVDFGAAQCIPAEGDKVKVQGTIEYLAPEIVKESDVNTAADLWGVGVLTYILLSGVSPFKGETDEETKSNVLYVRYHFDNLYKEVTQEATRFIMQLFKRTPQKRPSIDECFDNKWLLPSEFMIKKREHTVFLTHRIHEFSEEFHAKKRLATPPALLNMFGMSFSRSVSLETDTLEEF